MSDTDLLVDSVSIGKRAAAYAAAALVEEDMVVGLGTGSTSAIAIEALAERVGQGLRITTVATSKASARAAAERNLIVRDFASMDRLDIAIDGADEVDPQLRAIKGAGGAMLREKIIAAAADLMVLIIDDSKRVAALGAAPVPLEVHPLARSFVQRRTAELGARVSRRMAGSSPYRTDQGNLILDCHFDAIDDPEGLASRLAAIPGMLGHGLFIDEIDLLFVGHADGAMRIDRPGSAAL
jgi:ribose 5-phosphate isomerase A